jgi:hypothetical protein
MPNTNPSGGRDGREDSGANEDPIVSRIELIVVATRVCRLG